MPGDDDQHPPCNPHCCPEGSGTSKGACNHVPAVRQGGNPPQHQSRQTSSREKHDCSKASEPYHLQQANLQRSSAPSTLLTTSLAIEGSPLDVVPWVNASTGSDSGRSPTALQELRPTSTWHQPGFYPPGPDVGGPTALGAYLKTTPGTPQDDSLDSRSFLPTQSGVEVQDYNNLERLYGSSVPERFALWQQFSSAPPAANQADNLKACNCTQGHAYASCRDFIKHLRAWLEEERIKNDTCTCPPMDEGLLAWTCPKLAQHIPIRPHVQCELRTDCHLQDEPRPVPVDSIIGVTGVTGKCSCPNAEHYISTRCSLYHQHIIRAMRDKVRSHQTENPSSCSCAKSPVLVSKTCMTCINRVYWLEMDKIYESGGQSQNWDVESLMADGLAMFGSNKTNLARPSPIAEHLHAFDTGLLQVPDVAVIVNYWGQHSIEGQGHHLNALSPSIHEPNPGPCQPIELLPDHGGLNKMSKVPSDVDGNSRRVVTERVDGLSPHVGYGDSLVTRSTRDRKRSAPVGSPPSRVDKKRKIEPPPKAPPDHELSTSFPPARPSEEFESLCGGQKYKAKPLSAMSQGDYYYQKNTSPDQTYFDNVIQKLRTAPYLRHPQTLESTISSEEGIALMGDVRNEGPGRASDGESVYTILVDKPPSGPFSCWICGHLEKQRKPLRALGHVREHFEHRPWQCTQDHHDENSILKRRFKKRRVGPCGKAFSSKEALDDHQEKCNKLYVCRLGNCHRTFSTPSNRSKHERTQHHTAPVCLLYIFVTKMFSISSCPPNSLRSGRKYMIDMPMAERVRCLTPPLS